MVLYCHDMESLERPEHSLMLMLQTTVWRYLLACCYSVELWNVENVTAVLNIFKKSLQIAFLSSVIKKYFTIMWWGWAKWHDLPVASRSINQEDKEFVLSFDRWVCFHIFSLWQLKKAICHYSHRILGWIMHEGIHTCILFAAKNILRVCAQGDYYC